MTGVQTCALPIFLIISGAFKANMIIAAFSIVGVLLGASYMVWLYYRIALNEINTNTKAQLTDLDLREIATLLPLVILVFLIGLQPEILLSYMHVSVEHLLEQVHTVVPLETFNINHSINLVAEYFKELLWWV